MDVFFLDEFSSFVIEVNYKPFAILLILVL